MNYCGQFGSPAPRRWHANSGRFIVAFFSALTASAGYGEDVEIPVPNGNFESAANNGTVPSGLLGLLLATVSEHPLNNGPWGVTSRGILGTLVPPRVTINANEGANGYCRITGLAAANVLDSLPSNGASVTQTLTQSLEPSVLYTLEAEVDRGSLLTTGLLSRDGTGIALMLNETTVASSLTSTGHFLTLELLGGTRYLLQVRFATGENPPAGSLGIRLFSGEGAGLLHAGVIPDVTFDNVRLIATKLES